MFKTGSSSLPLLLLLLLLLLIINRESGAAGEVMADKIVFSRAYFWPYKMWGRGKKKKEKCVNNPTRKRKGRYVPSEEREITIRHRSSPPTGSEGEKKEENANL